MATNYCIDLITEAISLAGEPIQLREILERISHKLPDSNFGTIRTTLSVMVKNKIVFKVKFPKKSSFYCKPDWVDKKGNIKEELKFDPYWDKKKSA